MITEEELKQLAEQSYWVDSTKMNKPYTPEEDKQYYYDPNNKNSGKFKVLKIEDNPENGTQAMAVAPVDKDGNTDTSEIVIAYAGTNFKDIRDFSTDVQTVVLGKDGLSYSKISPHVNNIVLSVR